MLLSPRQVFDMFEIFHLNKLQDYAIQRRNTAYILSSFSGKEIQPADLYKLFPDEKDSSFISDEDLKNNSKEVFKAMDQKYNKAIEMSLQNRKN